jgi:5-methylthioadenosine/S-adenosylhomocysteine deaminase
MQAHRSRIVVKGGRVLDLDGDPHHPHEADILLEDGLIAALGDAAQFDLAETVLPGAEVIDARGKLVAPGFVNAHYHSHDVFLKGCFDPSILEFWALNALPRAYPPRSNDEIRLRTLLGAIECLRGGITTVQDMLTLFPLTAEQAGVVGSAYAEAGLRAVVGLQVADMGPLETVPFWRELIPPELQPMLSGPPAPAGAGDPILAMEEIFSAPAHSPLVRWAIAPSSPERCSRALLERLAKLARRRDLPVFSHIYISRAEALNARRSFADHSGSLVAYLDAIGLLNDRLTLAHGVWLDDEEIAAVASKGTNVVLNMLSNLKTKNGVAPIRKLLGAGVNLALGCDNCSCSDAQNMFQAMKLFTFLAAVSDPEEGPPDAVDALRAVTLGGARAVGLGSEIGAIRVGMRGDLIVLDATDPIYVPFNSAARQIVYGEGGRGVDTVIVDGRIVMRDRKIVTIDEAALRSQIDAVVPSFRHDAEVVLARAARLRPYVLEADRRIWQQRLGLTRYIGF